MNNKGFTLIELLAVIIIISLLALVVSSSVTRMVTDSKSELYDSQILLIKSAAESWGADNIYNLPDAGECSYITLEDLKEYGLLDSSIKNPKTNKDFDDNMKIKITTTKSKYDTDVIKYEVDSDNVDKCSYIGLYENGKIVYFNVKNASLCTKEEYESSFDGIDYANSVIGYNGLDGNEYQNSCLKFYAFNDNGGNKLNLLLDHNVTSNVSWSNSIELLKTATQDWSDTLLNSDGNKARMLTAMEIAKIVGNTTWNIETADTGFSYKGNCENGVCEYGWLYDRTSLTCENNGCYNNLYNTTDTNNGYWLNSLMITNQNNAYTVNSNGSIGYIDISSAAYSGVRPVIEVQKINIK